MTTSGRGAFRPLAKSPGDRVEDRRAGGSVWREAESCTHTTWDADGVVSSAWRFAGSAGGRIQREDCDSPNLLRCSVCAVERSIVCGSRRLSQCGPCEMRYRIRVRSIVRIPMQVARPGTLLLLTLTAPGAQSHCLTHTYAGEASRRKPRAAAVGAMLPQTGFP